MVKRASSPVILPNGVVLLPNGAVLMPNVTAHGKRRRQKKRWQYAMTMGRHGTSSAFVLRTPRRSVKKQAAKAAMRSVVLIGSHFGAGNDLLKRVFGELCQRSRLSLRCEPTWGGTHDLKSLASFKSKNKRLVWLESDANSLLRTVRNLRTHALDFRLVHVLLDPVQACAAQWPLVSSGGGANSTLPDVCRETLKMETLPALYKRAKGAKYKARALQLRLEDLVSRKAAIGAASWRQLFKFLELQQVSGDLTAIGQRAVSELELRSRVRNLQAPAWVWERERGLPSNATLHSSCDGCEGSWNTASRRRRGGGGAAKGGGGGVGDGGLSGAPSVTAQAAAAVTGATRRRVGALEFLLTSLVNANTYMAHASLSPPRAPPPPSANARNLPSQIVRQVIQEAAALYRRHLAPSAAHRAVREHEPLLCARHRDVEQSTLLLVSSCVCAVIMRQ